MIASGGQSSSRRLFAGYHAYVAGVCLVSLTAQPLLFGVEFLSGGKRDKGGAEGTVNRIQFSSQFSF